MEIAVIEDLGITLIIGLMIGPFEIFNPHQTWLMIVLIAGISFIGYIAIKIFGDKRGVYITGIFGGMDRGDLSDDHYPGAKLLLLI